MTLQTAYRNRIDDVVGPRLRHLAPAGLTRTRRVASTPARSALRWLALLGGRSLLPLAACGLILGTALWGPWIGLVLTYAWWRVVTWSA